MEVMEPVRGLSIMGECAVIPVGVKKTFVANVLTGNPVRFLWTFDLRHLHQTPRFSKEVRMFDLYVQESLNTDEAAEMMARLSLGDLHPR